MRTFGTRLIRSRAALVAIVVVSYVVAVFCSEKIGNGLGWDGQLYGAWVQKPLGDIVNRTISSYHISRILPLLIVHYGLVLFRAALSNRNIVLSFEIANVILIFINILVWIHVANRLALTVQGRWLGAVALFGGFAHLKMTAFDPVLVDHWGFTFAFIELMLFLDRRSWLLALTTLVGAFCWPTNLAVGTILIALTPSADLAILSAPPDRMGKLSLIVAAMGALGWVLLCRSVIKEKFTVGNDVDPISGPLVRLSIVVAALFVFFALNQIAAVLLPYVRQVHRYLLRPRVLGAIVIFAGTLIVQTKMSQEQTLTSGSLVSMTAFTSIQKPGIFLLAHVVFIGPIVLVMAMRWRVVVGHLARTGPALPLLALLGTFLFLNSESRRLWNLAAIVLPFVIKAIDDGKWSRGTAAVFAGLSLFFSKVWLDIDRDVPSPFGQFPAQLYFMNQGPWMSWSTYLLQGAIVVPVAFWVYQQLESPVLRSPRWCFKGPPTG